MAKSYKEKFKDEEGVWRTIGGRRVFIKTGQSLSDAMVESGKFKKVSDVKREEYQYKNDKLERERQAENSRKYIGKAKRTEEGQEAFNKYAELHDRTYIRENPQEADTTYDLVGQHINKEQQLRDIRNKYATNNGSGSDDNTSAYADKALDYWRKQREDTLARGGDTAWEDDSIKRWEKEKENRLYGEKEARDKLKEKTSNYKSMNEISIGGMVGELDANKIIIKDKNGEIIKNDLGVKGINKYGNGKISYYDKDMQLHMVNTNEADEIIFKNGNKEISKYKSEKDFHFAGEELYSDDPNRFGDKLRKYNEKMNPTKKTDVDLKNAEVMLRGSQRSLEFEKDGLERAKRDGQSVENLSDRTRRVHELELEVQEAEEYYNKMNAKVDKEAIRGNNGKAIDFNRKDDTFKYNGSYNDNMMYKARQDSIMVEKLGSKAVEEIRNGNITDEGQLNDYLDYGNSARSKAKPGYGYGYYELQRSEMWRDDLRDTQAYKEINAQANYWREKAKNELQQNTLPKKYKGTIEYLQSTTNMTIQEILELLKKIEQDKK